MSQEWCVITDVFEKDGLPSEGNLAAALVYEKDGSMSPMAASVLINMRQPVFTQGELLIVDGGREQCGRGRAPGKWNISYELFPLSDYKKAIARAREVS